MKNIYEFMIVSTKYAIKGIFWNLRSFIKDIEAFV